MGELDLMPATQSSEAGKYFEEQKLGLEISPQSLLKFDKVAKKIDFCYDPKVVTSVGARKTVKKASNVTWTTEAFFNIPA